MDEMQTRRFRFPGSGATVKDSSYHCRCACLKVGSLLRPQTEQNLTGEVRYLTLAESALVCELFIFRECCSRCRQTRRRAPLLLSIDGTDRQTDTGLFHLHTTTVLGFECYDILLV